MREGAGYLLGAHTWWCTGEEALPPLISPLTVTAELLCRVGLGLSRLILKLPCCGRSITLGSIGLLFITWIPRKLHLTFPRWVCATSAPSCWPLWSLFCKTSCKKISCLRPPPVCLFRLWEMWVKRWAPRVLCHSRGFAPGFFLGFLWDFRYLEVHLILHLENQALFQCSPLDATITECSGSTVWRVYEMSFFLLDTPRGSFGVLCSYLCISCLQHISSALLQVTQPHPAVSQCWGDQLWVLTLKMRTLLPVQCCWNEKKCNTSCQLSSCLPCFDSLPCFSAVSKNQTLVIPCQYYLVLLHWDSGEPPQRVRLGWESDFSLPGLSHKRSHYLGNAAQIGWICPMPWRRNQAEPEVSWGESGWCRIWKNPKQRKEKSWNNQKMNTKHTAEPACASTEGP